MGQIVQPIPPKHSRCTGATTGATAGATAGATTGATMQPTVTTQSAATKIYDGRNIAVRT